MLNRMLYWSSVLGFCVVSSNGFSTTCKMGSVERKVEIVTTDATKKVPCEVKYTKDGEEKVLWNATTDASYCETKASEFVAKLSSLGWQCDSATETQEPSSH